MKLIIDIPDNVYEMVMNTGTFGIYRFNTAKAIKNGTLLDDVKAEMEKQIERDLSYSEIEVFKVPCHLGTANGLQVAVRILDNIGKAESEDEK